MQQAMRTHKAWIIVTTSMASICILARAAAAAEPTTLQAADYLAERFTSRAAGLSFRPPRGANQIKPLAVGETVVQYVNPDERWSLKVSQLILEKPVPILGRDDPRTPAVDESKTRPGMLADIAQKLRLQVPAGQLLRQDLANVGPWDAGLLAIRYSQGTQTFLRQAALIRRSDRHYYLFELTTPSGHTADDPATAEDPAEAIAVAVFNAILDSVQLLDVSDIEADNKSRLYRSRTLMVNIPTRLPRALRAEQYFRVQRQGKDVGWRYVVEEQAERLGQKGIVAALLSYELTDGGVRNVASEMFCADDRRSETWVTVAVVEKQGKKDHVTEIGQSEKRIVRVLEGQRSGDENDPNQPAVGIAERHQLNVTQSSSAGTVSITRELSPYYLPAALSHLLPRLVPLDEPKGYLSAVWVGSEREVIHRYLDVQGPRVVRLGDMTTTAIVVSDRLGLEGEPTFHYLSPTGQYLGSQTPSASLQVLATDPATLRRLWPDANLARPHLLDSPPER